MWIVRLALKRPYTFVVLAILIALVGTLTAVFRMAVDIFPSVDIPVISVIWNYTGMSPDDMEKRIVWPYERILTTTVNDIDHIESQSLNGIGVVKVFFKEGAQIAAANAQITAVSQTALRQMPPGVQPPLVIQYSASNVPIMQLALASDTLTEQAMFDLATTVIRIGLIDIPGIQVPYPYGGKQRQIVVDLDPARLYSYGISPADVSAAVNAQNLILPAGSVKIGQQEYQVRLNSSPEVVSDLNNLPVKTLTNSDGTRTTVYVKDVASVRDGFQVQTNIVHTDGKRGVLISIYKNGNASTIDVVDAVKAKLPAIQAGLPPTAKDLKITPLFDQSVFVKGSIKGVMVEAVIAACLTGLMILLFLGSWRTTLIVVVSIPLSILCSILVLAALGQTLNTMTLGGLALAVGILVDDATVTIENIHRNLHMRKRLVRAILDGAEEIALPAFVSTLCICIVFVPVTFISGAAKYLFTPLAMAVVFAMLASYLLSRTLVPTMVDYLLKGEVEMYGGEPEPEDPDAKPSWLARHGRLIFAIVGGLVVLFGVLVALLPHVAAPLEPLRAALRDPWTLAKLAIYVALAALVLYGVSKYMLIWRIHYRFDAAFERARHRYGTLLAWTLGHPKTFAGAFLAMVVCSLPLFFFIGQDFFPTVDAGQIRLHVRAPAGTRIEQTEKYYADVQDIIRKVIPAGEVEVMLDNMGIPNSGINLSLSDGSIMSPAEGEILVAMNETHGPTAPYVDRIRDAVRKQLPELVVWSAPADIATQVLNFGLPASIDVQIAGPLRNADANAELARKMAVEINALPGVTDLRLQQVRSTPDLRVDVDRTLAGQIGVTQRDVASDLLISLSSSSQTSPNFWLNPTNGISYSILVQTPQYRVGSVEELTNTPIVPTSTAGGVATDTQLLGNLATVRRGISSTNLTHYQIQSTSDVHLGVRNSALGTVGGEVQNVIDKYKDQLPKGSSFQLRGQIESMHASYVGLGVGLIFAVVLVYLLMVVNFQSWLDPLIILMAVPGAFAGILWMLWATQTNLSVPALMGTIMCIGVATANSILMITFANDERKSRHDLSAHDASLEAGMTRLRPVVMTATAMIVGMLPMSLGLGEGGEQNAPLGRAVIGGLLFATVATLLFVPVVYSMLRRAPLHDRIDKELA